MERDKKRREGISVRNLRAARQGAKGFAFTLCMGNEAERGVGG